MPRFLLPLFASAFVLTACATVNTSGLSGESSRTVRGNPNAPVTVVEYADFQCPACRAAHDSVVEPLLAEHGDRIRFEFKHFPLRSIHPLALEAAEAAECAADQGRFWEYEALVFRNQNNLSSSALRTWATELSLDEELFDRCVRSGIKRETILDDYHEGVEMGVQGTPTFFVNENRVASRLDDVVAAINEAYARMNVPL